MNKKTLTEADIRTKLITPALCGANGDKWNVMTQIYEPEEGETVVPPDEEPAPYGSTPSDPTEPTDPVTRYYVNNVAVHVAFDAPPLTRKEHAAIRELETALYQKAA